MENTASNEISISFCETAVFGGAIFLPYLLTIVIKPRENVQSRKRIHRAAVQYMPVADLVYPVHAEALETESSDNPIPSSGQTLCHWTQPPGITT